MVINHDGTYEREPISRLTKYYTIGGYADGYSLVRANFIVASDDGLYAWGGSYYDFMNSALGLEDVGEDYYDIPVLALRDVKSVNTVGLSTYAIKKDGSLWGCGKVVKGHYKGGIGDGSYETVQTFKKIMSDVESVYQIVVYEDVEDEGGDEPFYHYATTRYAVKSDGSVWAWGSGENGLLGHGGTKRADKPVKIMDPKYS